MHPIDSQDGVSQDELQVGLLDLALPLVRHVRLLVIGPLVVGAAALGISYLITPTFTASTTFLPPQQQQSGAASALASLGALSGLAGAAGAIKSPGDQYISLLRSNAVADRLVDQFKLMEVYGSKFRFEARQHLAANVRIGLGKKDGLITVDVDDESPQRAMDLANQHVAELRRLTGELALTEAQQRRVFFDGQLKQTRDRLVAAQQTLQNSGFNPGVLRAEPKAAAEGYARLKAEVTAAEVKLQTQRQSLSDNAPEVRQQQTLLAALREQLSRLEVPTDTVKDGDYLGKYRDFKYQETLFELFSRQYEAARLDESREGALIQVIDAATLPEHKSKPKRAYAAIVATAVSAVLMVAGLVLRHLWQLSSAQPGTARRLEQLRLAWRRR